MSYTYIASGADNDPVIRRAFAAYFRYLSSLGALPTIPANDSDRCELDGKEYVTLRNVNGTLAVYRVRNNGALKRLRRWPEELEAA